MDIIAYIPDLLLFRAEATLLAEQKVKGFNFDQNGNLNYGVTKIPVVYNLNKSVCLLRLNTEDKKIFDAMTTVVNIGTFNGTKYVFKTGGKAKYEAVYNTKQQTITDNQGGTLTYTSPYMIGVFA